MTAMREAQEAYDNRAEPEVDDDFEARVAAVELIREKLELAETYLYGNEPDFDAFDVVLGEVGQICGVDE